MTADAAATVNPAAVAAGMAAAGLTVQPPLTLRPLTIGMSNITLEASDAAGHRWVLRRPPRGPVLASAHDVAREYRILSALNDTDAPAPRVYLLADDPAVSDAPVAVMEHVTGLVPANPEAVTGLDADQRRRCGLSLMRALGRVHSVDLSAAGLETLASTRPYAARQLSRWTRQMEDGPDPVRPAMSELAGCLRAAIPAQPETTLVHGDCHLANVILGSDGAVRCLLDWELCTLGDPLSDVGTALAYWPHRDDPDPPGPYPQSTLPGFASRGELAAEYAAATGRDTATVGFWTALAAWKIAVISKGVLERARARGTGPDELAVIDDRIGVMLRRAATAAADAGL